MTHFRILSGALALMITPIASGQWSSDPASNFALANTASDQTQSKIVATEDGGAFVSWYDGIGTGYDVRIQRLDAAGNEVMPHLGTLVADRGFSSTQDYGLGTDFIDFALLAFRDDRLTGTQITAARISPSGVLAWGAPGIQLTNTNSFVASPKIAGTSDAGVVVAWTQDSTVRVQKLSPAGVKQWASDVVMAPGAGSYSVADLHAHGDDVIVSMVHQTGGFTSPKRLVTQKLDASGAAVWGAAPVKVFDNGSLQFGNFPPFVPDGTGGGVFAWYGTSPLQCYVQRILSDGSEGFPHNGVPVSTNAAQIRVSPTVSFISETNETLVSWREQNGVQSQFGLGSQKLSATGQRLWGPQGVTLVPLGTAELSNVRNVGGQYSGFVYYTLSVGLGLEEVRGVRIGADGLAIGTHFAVSSAVGGKARLAVAGNAIGQSILSWNDERSDGGDIYAQNVNCDGSLGAPSTTAGWTDLGNGLAGQGGVVPVLTGSGVICAGEQINIAATQALPNSSIAIIVGLSAINAPLLGGTLVPNPDFVILGLSTGFSGTYSVGFNVPPLPSGFSTYFQIWISDPAGVFGYSSTNGLKMTAP